MSKSLPAAAAESPPQKADIAMPAKAGTAMPTAILMLTNQLTD
jgi:hypothetical protein